MKIKLLMGSIFITICLLNIYVITGQDNKSKLFLSSITRIALADDEGGGEPKWIKYSYVEGLTTTFYTEDCGEGKTKNCMKTTGTKYTNCLSGGNVECTPGTEPFESVYCGDCI